MDSRDEPGDEQPRETRNGRWSDYYHQSSFRGTFYLAEQPDLENATQSIQKAREMTLCARESTNDDFMLAMFTDGSPNPNPRDTSGGYAVVFENHCPGTPFKRERLQMAWHMPNMLNSTVGEALAFAQALQVAIHQLRTIRRDRHDNSVKTVVLAIFSDAFEVLQMIKQGHTYLNEAFHLELLGFIIRLVHRLSHEVCSINGYDVNIEVYWVKGHAGVPGNECADNLAKQARAEKRNIFFSGGRRRDAMQLPEAVHMQIMDELRWAAERHRLPRARISHHSRRRNERGTNNRQSYLHRRGNHDHGGYNPPSWASESFSPILDRRGMPQHPGSSSPSSLAGRLRSAVEDSSRPSTDDSIGHYNSGSGRDPRPDREQTSAMSTGTTQQHDEESTQSEVQSDVNHRLAHQGSLDGEATSGASHADGEILEQEVLSNIDDQKQLGADEQAIETTNPLNGPLRGEQEQVTQEVADEVDAIPEPAIKASGGILAAGVEPSTNDQPLDCQKAVDGEEEEALPELEGQITFNNKKAKAKAPTPDADTEAPINSPGAGDGGWPVELEIYNQPLVDLQPAREQALNNLRVIREYMERCEYHPLDARPLPGDNDAYSSNASHIDDDVRGQDETQAAADRQLLEQVEATLPGNMASQVQEDDSSESLSGRVPTL
ncbi:hypothetical protein B0T20DRAFT_466475 [Sordaria brevicollis]|uniref:RNase H type-1 domain-containing protein n=1 Tax=Sordaria brevicollis TaxID=83679 RepID=A0AAE0PK88_SORBR|nr:hypothetical protein B0T20DRAFT_466475 [Sordaria brevicollis]